MNRSVAFFLFACLVGCLPAEEPVPVSVGASGELRGALSNAESINVYEGLPHQLFESDLLVRESKRKDTQEIGSFRFYTPAVPAGNLEVLKGILSSEDSIQIFGGDKLCGGFHPDYAVEWFDEKGSRFYAQICFGCHEIIYRDGKKEYRYDLEKSAFEELKKELVPYARKRPKAEG